MNRIRLFYYALRSEMWKLFGKKRTYIGFAMCMAAESLVLFLFRYTHGPRRELMHRLELAGYDGSLYITGLTMATSVLVPVAYVLLPLYMALVGGDLVAKEAEDGTLRMILCRPVSRLGLVLVKWLAGALFAILLTLVLSGFGLLLGSLLFRSGGLFAMMPMGGVFSIFDFADGLKHYAATTVVLGFQALTIMGLAWMFSCGNVKPAAATILALSVIFVSRIVQEIPYFHQWQDWFLTYHLGVWMKLFLKPVPWVEVIQSLCILAGFDLTFIAIGCAIFHTRDIKS